MFFLLYWVRHSLAGLNSINMHVFESMEYTFTLFKWIISVHWIQTFNNTWTTPHFKNRYVLNDDIEYFVLNDHVEYLMYEIKYSQHDQYFKLSERSGWVFGQWNGIGQSHKTFFKQGHVSLEGIIGQAFKWIHSCMIFLVLVICKLVVASYQVVFLKHFF